MIKYFLFLFLALSEILLQGAALAADKGQIATHAITSGSVPKYSKDFSHLEYVNPVAPKGGELKLHALGTFDTINPFTLKGVSANGLSLVFETLMTSTLDELDTRYGLIAESIIIPDDISYAEFVIRKEARWHDGKPITPEDVIFTFEILKEKGHPNYRYYYASVIKAVKSDSQKVKFIFSGEVNRELPSILGQLPVLSSHYFKDKDFTQTTLTPITGSGPYRIKTVSPGKSITYERVKEYWGAELPINIGQYNFDTVRYDYYRDEMIALEAFKAGEYDLRPENTAKNWATGYESPALQKGWMIKEEIPHKMHQGTQGYVFNIRRALFKDVRVRKALCYAFDFEWSNRNLFFNQYNRTESFFTNSPWQSSQPPSEEEIKILESFRGNIPAEAHTQVFKAPRTDGSGQIRDSLKVAITSLKEAGWELKGGKLFNIKTNEPFQFEILHDSPSMERISLPFKKNLSKLGIEARVRTVDTSQYEKRIESFDYDMTTYSFPIIISPGNEQREYWGSQAADTPGSLNVVGVKNQAIDKLIDLVISAPDEQSLLHRARAFDRVLLFNYFIIPQWHISKYRIAYWDKFSRSQTTPSYGFSFVHWWEDGEKFSKLKKRMGK